MWIRASVIVCLLAATVAAATPAQAAGWATDDAGVLYQVFPLRKEVDRVGVVVARVEEGGRTWSETPSLTDLALHEERGMYGISYTHLYKIDALDPSRSVRVGLLATGFGMFNALAFGEDGTLYALSGNTLFVVDLATGKARKVASLGSDASSDGDLAWIDGALYATVNARLGCHLLRIDPKSWATKDVGRIQTRAKPAKEGDPKGATRRLETTYDDVWGLIWDGRALWALTPSGEVIEVDVKTATATPHYRVQATFWGACPMLRI